MSRPASINDIPTYARSGDTLITIQLTQIAASGKILAAAAALVTAVEKTPGVSVSQQYGQITVTKDKTPEEVTETLRTYQTEWDSNLKVYQDWLENGVPEDRQSYTVQSMLSWATKEDQQTEFLIEALRDAKIREASK